MRPGAQEFPLEASIAPRDWRQHWPGWVIMAAGSWSLLYRLLGLYWTLGGAGFPFDQENDRSAALSLLGNVQTAGNSRCCRAQMRLKCGCIENDSFSGFKTIVFNRALL